MKTKIQITQKSGARFLAIITGAALAGSTLAACSNSQPTAPAENAVPAPMDTPSEKPINKMAPDKPSASKTYRDIGAQVVSVNAPAENVAGAKTTVTLDHEEIPDFMRAMQMTVPLQNPDDAKQLKKGHKIRFDFVMENGSLVVANIRVLPSDTKLKLAPA